MRKLLALIALLLVGPAVADGINIPGPAYVAGTWLPAVTGASVAGTGQTYTFQVGSYEQNGRTVIARFSIALSSIGTASGNLQLSLPVASANVANDNATCSIGFYSLTSNTALNYGVIGLIAPNASIATLNSMANTAVTAITVANLGASGSLAGTCIYRAS